jgi:hypothetical protein
MPFSMPLNTAPLGISPEAGPDHRQSLADMIMKVGGMGRPSLSAFEGMRRVIWAVIRPPVRYG